MGHECEDDALLGEKFLWNLVSGQIVSQRLFVGLRQIAFKEGVYFEDIGFTIRALYHMQMVATVPGPTYYYRVNTQSITRQMTDRKQQDLLAAREDFLEFAQKHHLYDCGEKWYILRKIFYNFMGIPVMKIHEWKTIKKYYLFGLIKVFEKRISL